MHHVLELAEAKSERFQSTLRALNPYAVLDRGYAMVQDENGILISKATQLLTDKTVEVIFSDGKVHVRRTA